MQAGTVIQLIQNGAVENNSIPSFCRSTRHATSTSRSIYWSTSLPSNGILYIPLLEAHTHYNKGCQPVREKKRLVFSFLTKQKFVWFFVWFQLSKKNCSLIGWCGSWNIIWRWNKILSRGTFFVYWVEVCCYQTIFLQLHCPPPPSASSSFCSWTKISSNMSVCVQHAMKERCCLLDLPLPTNLTSNKW